MDREEMLTTSEAARALGVGATTVRLWCAQGKVPGAVRVGPAPRGEFVVPFSSLGKIVRVRRGRPRKS